jgi:hypothetical protein
VDEDVIRGDAAGKDVRVECYSWSVVCGVLRGFADEGGPDCEEEAEG